MTFVSVIMPCHNQTEFIDDAIESVINQTHQDFELIIINDGSTDNSKNKIIEWTLKQNRITFVQTNDIGASKSRNLGVEMSQGKYFVPLDADDKIFPEFLEETIDVLENNPNHGFCYTDSIFSTKDGDRRMVQPEYNFHDLLLGNYICYCSLINRDIFDEIGGYDKNNFNYFEDYMLWIALGQKGYYGKHLAEPLFWHRVHDKGMTGKTDKFAGIYKAFIIRKFPELYPHNWQDEVDKVLANYPANFMSLKPFQQEEIYSALHD